MNTQPQNGSQGVTGHSDANIDDMFDDFDASAIEGGVPSSNHRDASHRAPQQPQRQQQQQRTHQNATANDANVVENNGDIDLSDVLDFGSDDGIEEMPDDVRDIEADNAADASHDDVPTQSETVTDSDVAAERIDDDGAESNANDAGKGNKKRHKHDGVKASDEAPGDFNTFAQETKRRFITGGQIHKKTRLKDMYKMPFVIERDVPAIKKKIRGSDIRYNLVQVLLIAFVISCVGFLGVYYSTMAGNDTIMREVATEYTVSIPQEITDIDEMDLPPLVDWDGLRGVNDEVSGWLRIPDTTVDYMVMTTKVKEKYLRKDIYENYSINGSLFTDWTNEADYSQQHIVIYGHHLPWPAMFHDVSRYIEEPGFFDAHRKMYLETPETCYELTAVGVYRAEESEYQVRQTQFGSTEDFQKYLDERLAECDYVYRDDVDRRTMDKLVTLVTCTDNGEARCIVECVVTKSYPTSYVPNVRAYMTEQATHTVDGNQQQEQTQQ